ncbi:hypothetical protein L1987_30265 [Smallanthus sonchifolius]|uniref:Uncharacterized protein n=1 Tax=Smallanthus sonchifolius TaxID=185202 RepID=A0ACB9I350_9ASTR|nr:hypothetical protein L1987_30265 [Smallanthus sonchifolius]
MALGIRFCSLFWFVVLIGVSLIFLLHGCSLLLLMERADDSDGDDCPKPNNLADKIKKIDVPIKEDLSKPDKCEFNLESDLNSFAADNVFKSSGSGLFKARTSSFVEKLKGDQISSKANKGKEKEMVDDDGFTIVGNKKKASKKAVVIKEKPRSLFVKQGNLHSRVKSLRADLDLVQKDMDLNLADVSIRNAAANAVVDHFRKFLGQKGMSSRLLTHDLFSNVIDSQVAENMIRDVSNDEIWCSLRSKGGMSHIQGKWDDIATWLIPRATSKSARVVIAKLQLAAIAYYIWQERNARFFKNQLRPPEKVEKLIVNMIRLKLHSLKFKMNDRVRRILDDWKIASVDVMMDD